MSRKTKFYKIPTFVRQQKFNPGFDYLRAIELVKTANTKGKHNYTYKKILKGWIWYSRITVCQERGPTNSKGNCLHFSRLKMAFLPVRSVGQLSGSLLPSHGLKNKARDVQMEFGNISDVFF